jgi:hypothetical protein
MALLTDRELAEVRSEMEVFMPETGRVLVQAEVGDGAGGSEETFEPGEDIPVGIESVASGEGRAGERVDARSTHIVTVPALTPVRTVDRIQIDDRGDFEVTAVYQQSEPLTLRVEVKEVV